MRLSTAIRGTSLTAGNGRPQGGGYRWRGIPGWGENTSPQPPPARSLSNQASQEAARERREQFAQYRAEGWSVNEAGELVGIVPETARKYEARRKQAAGGGS